MISEGQQSVKNDPISTCSAEAIFQDVVSVGANLSDSIKEIVLGERHQSSASCTIVIPLVLRRVRIVLPIWIWISALFTILSMRILKMLIIYISLGMNNKIVYKSQV